MERNEFIAIRKKLERTQKEMAQLLGVSVKAIHSYEQGWRIIPAHVERQALFMAARMVRIKVKPKPCWSIKKCPPERKRQCPAWQFRAGNLCWFINGTICRCRPQENWKDKIKICRKCEAMQPILDYFAAATSPA